MTDECLVNILRISERPDLLYSAQRIEALCAEVAMLRTSLLAADDRTLMRQNEIKALKAERGLELAEVARLEAEVKRLTKRVEVREVAKKGWTR